jgi:hypothetical protein
MTKLQNLDFRSTLKYVPQIVNSDIYTGTEKIQFNNRHPIFKALMKLEFEDVIRTYNKRINQVQNTEKE